jgi:hypothetical protein
MISWTTNTESYATLTDKITLINELCGWEKLSVSPTFKKVMNLGYAPGNFSDIELGTASNET